MSKASAPRTPRLGLRNESLILLPVAILLLVVLSAVVLFSYWQGLETIAGERREEASRAARRAAGLLAAGEVSTPGELRRFLPEEARLALVDESGREVFRIGRFDDGDLLAPALDRDLDEPFAVGPTAGEDARIVAFAPLEMWGERRLVRLDLPARRLAAQRRSAGILLWVVAASDLAAAVLLFLVVRKMLSPLETMLARARQVAPEPGEPRDEVTHLLSTFERALEAFSKPRAEDVEADIRTLERTLGTGLESGLLLVDPEGRTLSLNAVGGSLLGVPQPRPGAPLQEVLGAHPELARLLGEVVEGGEAVQRQEIEIDVGDRRSTLGLSVHALRRESGEVRAYLALFADLTEVRRIQEERRLSTALADLGELAAGIAHEMRNSLATVTGYLALMERAAERQEIDDYIGELRRETGHVRRVLEDFLSFARPGTAKMDRVDLERVARRAADDPTLAPVEVRVERAAEAETFLRGDRQLLERAVRNLLRNAVEAQQRAGVERPVEVVVEASPATLRLAVSDRGDGIADDVRERLFRPFSSSREDGVGMGLALARRIVDLHRGRLTLADRPGGGAEATISFDRG